jgi:nifR3 family TIM-barrel protein
MLGMTKLKQESFTIGKVLIPGNVLLAPMDGYTDQPFRLFIRELGSSASISEFINGIDVARGNPHLPQRISFDEKERPFGYQILDDDPKRILRTAHFLEQRKPDFLDLNIGCPSKPIIHRGAGSALLKEPEKIGQIFTQLKAEIILPLTAKIRIGWDQTSRNYLEVSRILEENGAQAIFVHARTRKQGYSGQADWDVIAEVKQKAHIPIIGNGDIHVVADIQKMFDHTHCDAVMIGRASVSNPWIFAGLDRNEVTRDQIFSSLSRLVDLLQGFYGEELGLKLLRKFLVHILAPLELSRDQRISLFECGQKELLFAKLEELYPGNLA